MIRLYSTLELRTTASFFLFLVLFFSTSRVNGVYNFENGVVVSCLNSKVNPNPSSYCDFVSWSSANIYPATNFSYFAPPVPMSISNQNNYAVYLQSKLAAGGSTSSGACNTALKSLACVTAFPECPLSGTSISSVAYFTPCRLHCDQVNKQCPFSLNCNSYSVEDCMLYVPSGYFVLSPSQGPYTSLPILYGFVLATWFVMTVIWNFLTFIVYKDTCVLLCRAVSGIPVIKCFVLVFGASFWSTCVSR